MKITVAKCLDILSIIILILAIAKPPDHHFPGVGDVIWGLIVGLVFARGLIRIECEHFKALQAYRKDKNASGDKS